VTSTDAAARAAGDDDRKGRTQTTVLLERLREDLLAGGLLPGAPLRMGALRQRYGAGTTPLREALFQLVSQGLVTVEDQRGFFAARVSLEDLKDLTEQRVLIESHALRLAIDRGDLAWEARLVAAHHLLSGTPVLETVGVQPGLSAAWAVAHRQLHRVIVEACGSLWLLRFCEVMADQSERYRRLSVRAEPGRDVVGEHRRIVESVLRRDSDGSVTLLAEHYRRTAELCRLSDRVDRVDAGRARGAGD
jgi:GntR family carbon starvation induced transcriptional regulator